MLKSLRSSPARALTQCQSLAHRNYTTQRWGLSVRKRQSHHYTHFGTNRWKWVAVGCIAAGGWAIFQKISDANSLPDESEWKSLELEDYPIEEAILTAPPFVPPPIERDHPAIVRAHFHVNVKEDWINDSDRFEFWTFNDSVPGPFVRARVGDILEMSMTNCDESGMQHNIDFHSVIGPGGGAVLLTADKHEQKVARFRLLHPGLFIYHCSVDPISIHISNGMFGLMLVEPETPLPKVDKEFYVVQSELYTTPPEENSSGGVLDYSMDDLASENPTFIYFNGKVGSLLEENSLKAKTNDDVRIYFGNAGTSRISSFHVIGSCFDRVWRDGDVMSPPARNIQTTLVPCGGTTVVDLKARVPGTYALVDHALNRTEKGCVGFLDVKGEDRPDIFHSAQPPKICSGCKTHR